MAFPNQDYSKRGYLLPPGCKDLVDVLKGATPLKLLSASKVRVNGQIRAREVRVIGEKGQHLGIMLRSMALSLARSGGIDLVEIAPNAKPPICRLVDYGKFLYQLTKRRKRKK